MLNNLRNSPKLQDFKARHPVGNAIVIIVAIIMFWRGLWGLLDLYFFPGSPAFSYLVSVGIGVLVLYIDKFSIDNLKR